MSTKVFITGISGFIGQALAAALKSRGYAVSGISRHGPDAVAVRVKAADLLLLDDYEDWLLAADVIVHLASPTTAREITESPLKALRANAVGTALLLDKFAAGGGKKFIFLSSGKVYGKATLLPYNEDSPLNPDTVLGRCKKAGEELLALYAACSDKSYAAVRLFNAYGPGQKEDFLVPTIMRQVGKPVIELGDIFCKRDYVFLDDVIAALIAIIEHRDGECRLHSYNVGSGESYSACDIVSRLEEITNTRMPIAVRDEKLRYGEGTEERSDITRMMELGWQPHFDLEAGLAKTWEVYASKRAK